MATTREKKVSSWPRLSNEGALSNLISRIEFLSRHTSRSPLWEDFLLYNRCLTNLNPLSSFPSIENFHNGRGQLHLTRGNDPFCILTHLNGSSISHEEMIHFAYWHTWTPAPSHTGKWSLLHSWNTRDTFFSKPVRQSVHCVYQSADCTLLLQLQCLRAILSSLPLSKCLTFLLPLPSANPHVTWAAA